MKYIFVILLATFLHLSLDAQVKLTWEELEDVEFSDTFSDDFGDFTSLPAFGKTPVKYNNKEVYISGYMIPVDAENNYYVLSRFTFNMCFFCGKAGPESVIQLKLAEGHRQFFLDERVTLKGNFRLNYDDMTQCYYLLLDAVEYKK